MANNIVTIEHFSKVYTERQLFDDTDFYLQEGEKAALIGINGTGKSTLLKIVAGLEEPDQGRLVMRRGLSIRFLPQNPEFHPEDSILEAVLRDNEGKQHVYNLEAEAKKMLTKLGIEDLTARMGTLSGGQRKRIALASTLLSTADLLILDEPTNHLDGEMSEWLESYLKAFKGSLLMVTHDRYFLDSVCDRIMELDQGKIYSYKANYEGYLELKAERMDIAKAQERTRQNILRNELKWIRRGAKARTTKQKGRIQRYEKLSEMHGPVEDAELKLSSISSRIGKTTIEIDNISKGFGDKTLIRDFTYYFLRNDRVGIIGPNGSGKSTLLKMITGREMPDQGEIRIGQTIKIGYFSQENEDLDGDQRVIDAVKSIAEYVPTVDGSISASVMLDRFLFPPSQQYMMVSKLSGGEKRRLYLLQVLMSAPNVLILDEPTNDLDIRTMTILEDYLDQFQGIVITVSHDRYFLDRCVNRIFAFEGNGKISQYEGGFTDYQVEYLRRHPELEGSGSVFANGGSIAGVNTSVTGQLTQNTFGDAMSQGASTSAASGRGTHRLKFSYKEQKEWESIESEIDQLESRISELDQEILKNANDFIRLNELTEQKNTAEAMLDQKMERWEYLSELASRIEAENS
jgi:ATP-binding cassette subfamily F protein uup